MTTLQLGRRSAAAPLGRIDYNVDILAPARHHVSGWRMAAPPCLLTPAQAALAHALGTVHGPAYAMHA